MWLNTSRGASTVALPWQSLKFAKFQSVKNKASSKRLICHDTNSLPSPRLNNLSFWERKHQFGVSRMGICVQRYIKYLKCHSFSGNFFREKNKKDRCGGTQERIQMFENKERAEKQLLTLLTPAVLPPLNFILSPPRSKRKLLQHPFPSRNYMHRLPIHGELLFLIQRNNVAFW